jgi:signal transduction histidine kinase
MERGEPVLWVDIEKDAEIRPTMSMIDLNLKSVLCVPLKIGGRVLGSIYVDNSVVTGNFTQHELNLLTTLSGQTAIAIENASLYNNLEDKVDQLAQSNRELTLLKNKIETLLRGTKEMAAAKDEVSAIEVAIRYIWEEISKNQRYPVSVEVYFKNSKNEISYYQLEGQHTFSLTKIDDFRSTEKSQTIFSDVDEIVGSESQVSIPIRKGGVEFAQIYIQDVTLEQDKSNFIKNIANSLALVLSNLRYAEKESLAMVGQMASGIIHDLRQPMGIILGYADMMAKSQLSQEIQTDLSTKIVKQIRLAEDMVSDIMDFVRGKMYLDIKEYSLKSYMKEISQFMDIILKGTTIDFVYDLEYDGKIYMDADRFRRVIFNIVGNASDAMKTQLDGEVSVTVRKDDKDIIFLFSDNGPGIPEPIQDSLFEPFATSGKAYGTGLGMAISKKIVEEHDGTITFSTEKGEGTTFKIVLPQDGDGVNGLERRSKGLQLL